jgi:secondary thiamine-phosphate synthase enzyme
MLKEITIKTNIQTQILDITSQVQNAVGESGIAEGLCCVFVPHTTAGVTINENADPRKLCCSYQSEHYRVFGKHTCET